MRKFRRAQAENQAAIKKHLVANFIESSSEDEENEEELENAVTKVLSKYEGEEGDTNKISSYLNDTFQTGGAVCLICISSVKKSDPIWSCGECYTFLHLPCIQHWIRDTLNYKHEKGLEATWGCPKCRTEYQESELPRKYLCFCGKTEDPAFQPWLIPHSCGDVCGKYLQPKCGHKCTLLCHPGPCPPCPKMISVKCFCGKSAPCPRRCNSKEWSCGEVCNKKYEICAHRCTEKCHPGNCPECPEMIRTKCHCESKLERRKCSESLWKCDKICGRSFSCNVHTCQEFCHKSDDCGKCPLESNRTCPCGKKKYSVSCTQEEVPTCGDTCGKLLECGSHRCNMRCHTERCGQCLEVVNKTCRCGSFTKELTCTKDYHCNKKCTQMRLCGRHTCNKKCCDCLIKNKYNVCEKVCDNTLNCRKHKCPAPCHSGPCYPCPKTIVIQCRCGSSKITVPCGTVKRIKPPRCNKKCVVPSICNHPKRETHKCHQGQCPPCKKICGSIYKRCGHACVAVCHTKVWTKITNGVIAEPKGPWELNFEEKWEYKTTKCPPCEVSMMITCLGGHETLPWPCHNAYSRSCLRECGQLLACTNHKCEKLCHKIDPESEWDDDKCTECEKPCSLPRPVGCTHICPKICHPAPCNPCKQLVKVSCHCKINFLYIRCAKLTSATEEDKKLMLRCGNQCPKIYPCGHRCVDDCHFGECEKAELCNKKVKVFCKCKRLKKEFSCLQIRTKNRVVECDDVCRVKKEEQDRIKNLELERKRREEELKNQREIEMFEKKFKPKKRGKDKSRKEDLDKKNFPMKGIWISAVIFFFISIIIIFYSEIVMHN